MTTPLGMTKIFCALAAVMLILLSFANFPWTLDEYDQAKQAFTSFEMVKEGHWLYQDTPNGKVATKPPLVGWISAGIFEVTRSWGIGWRLPSLAAAFAMSMSPCFTKWEMSPGFAPCSITAVGPFSFQLAVMRRRFMWRQ